MFFIQRPQLTDPGPGKKGAIEGKEWVLGRGSHQDDHSLLEVGKKGILLAFIEMVDLVQEKDGGLLVKSFCFGGLVKDFAQVGQARSNGVYGYEPAFCTASHQPGKSGFSRTWRAVQDKGNDPVGFQKAAQQF